MATPFTHKFTPEFIAAVEGEGYSLSNPTGSTYGREVRCRAYAEHPHNPELASEPQDPGHTMTVVELAEDHPLMIATSGELTRERAHQLLPYLAEDTRDAYNLAAGTFSITDTGELGGYLIAAAGHHLAVDTSGSEGAGALQRGKTHAAAIWRCIELSHDLSDAVTEAARERARKVAGEVAAGAFRPRTRYITYPNTVAL